MEKLENLDLSGNQFADQGMKAVCFGNRHGGTGSLPSLQMLSVDLGALGTEHPQLKAVCEARGIDLP